MGFLLYHVSGPGRTAAFTLVRKLQLVGPSGALSAWLASRRNEETPFDWKLSGKGLVAALAPEADPSTHAIVMDMMPEKLAGASLCHVTSLAGRSEAKETDLVIVMREVNRVGESAPGVDPRLAFVCDTCAPGSDLVESMGLTGGTKGGTCKWCAPKMNIGAAVIQTRTPR